MFSKAILLGLLTVPWTLAITVGTLPESLKLSRDRFVRDQIILQPAESFPVPENRTIESNHTLRNYSIHIPSEYDPSTLWPVLIDFHGRHGSPVGQWNNSQYFRNPSGQGYFLVYPMGCLGVGNPDHPEDPPETAWQGAPYANENCNDTLFTSDLLDSIQKNYSIDSTRIYASGKSNGGGFVDFLACSNTGDRFAAFAMASAALYTDTIGAQCNYTSKQSRRILEAHGANDTTIPLEGRNSSRPGWSTPNITRWARQWAVRGGCNPDHDGSIINESWGNRTAYSCNGQGNIVQQYTVQGLGHCWPSVVGNTDFTEDPRQCDFIKHPAIQPFDYTQAVLQFFGLNPKAA